MALLIENTEYEARHPWPTDVFLQGGSDGHVFVRGGGRYHTAFVEAMTTTRPGTFLRGEGKTLADAEDSCWARYARMTSCAAHPAHGPFEARGYRNGSGFCVNCETWFSGVLPKVKDDDDD